ncbi:hypothetical protein QE152_g34812 [Popillia japonica]|uniref:CCHC-type domain-containing protein n=1 Tax=Popillia japonica TaxID=7064 RepID=A0AAW1ITF1_POPJA
MATSESVGMVFSTSFNIEPYEPTVNFIRWLQRLEGAFKVFKVPEPEYTAYLLHYIGAKAFDVLCDKINPKDPYTEQYSVLKTALEDFYAPAPLEIAENFRFHQRRQKEGETLQDYIASLQKLSINCKFGDYLTTALRNQFVFGLQSKRIQSRLLGSADLTFDRAVKIATGMELCEKDAQQLNNPSTVVNAVTAKQKKKPYIRDVFTKTVNSKVLKCFRCGGTHLANKCTLDRNIKCNSCGQKGHLQRVCFKKAKGHNTTNNTTKETVSTHQVEELLHINTVFDREKYTITLPVQGKMITFEIDSGAGKVTSKQSQKGHLQRVCFKKAKGHNTTKETVSTHQVEELLHINTVFDREKYTITLPVQGKMITFEIDSGAGGSASRKRRDTILQKKRFQHIK